MQTPLYHFVVVGGVNIDINGTSTGKIVPADSNPGRVSIAPGGVGRNIAENLSRMGQQVTMLTALGDDLYGQYILQNSQSIGIDLFPALTVPGVPTSTYLCLSDQDGDLYAAINDMGICDRITPAYLAEHLSLLNGADLVIVDANIPEESILWLAEHCTAPLAADPVSSLKARKLLPVLDRLVTLKPNRPEASLLTGVVIDGLTGVEDAAQAFLEKGVKKAFVSLGSQGVYYRDESQHGIQPCCRGRIVNTTGCGDAFLAAVCLAYVMGMDMAGMALMGQAASSVCAEADAAVNPAMTLQAVLDRMNAVQ